MGSWVGYRPVHGRRLTPIRPPVVNGYTSLVRPGQVKGMHAHGSLCGAAGVVANPWNRHSRKGLDSPPYKRPPRTAELRWDRAMLANGGVEPIEWAPELEHSPESVEVQA